MKAINPKNQSAVNRAVKQLVKYNDLNNHRDAIEGEFGEDSAKWRAIDRKCAFAFDRYEDWCDDLPEYEVKNIESSELY